MSDNPQAGKHPVLFATDGGAVWCQDLARRMARRDPKTIATRRRIARGQEGRDMGGNASVHGYKQH